MAAVLAAAAPLHALTPAPPALDARGSAIDIVVVGAEQDALALSGTLGPNEFRGAEARIRRGERLTLDTLLHAGAADALVRCYVDLSTPGRADLYFADRNAERFLVRQVALPDGGAVLELDHPIAQRAQAQQCQGRDDQGDDEPAQQGDLDHGHAVTLATRGRDSQEPKQLRKGAGQGSAGA